MRPSCAQTWPDFDRSRASSTNSGKCGPDSTKHGPDSTHSGPDSAKIGPDSTEIRQVSAELSSRPSLARIRPHVSRIPPNFSEFARMRAPCQFLADVAQLWVLSTESGRTQFGPTLAKGVPDLARFRRCWSNLAQSGLDIDAVNRGDLLCFPAPSVSAAGLGRRLHKRRIDPGRTLDRRPSWTLCGGTLRVPRPDPTSSQPTPFPERPMRSDAGVVACRTLV